MRSLVQIYALAVCFATLMCFVVALGIASYDVIQLSAPGFTLQWQQIYQSNEAFAQYHPRQEELDDAALTEARERAFRDALHAERRSAQQSLAFVSIILVIDIVVFGVHWRIGRREDVTAPEPSDS